MAWEATGFRSFSLNSYVFVGSAAGLILVLYGGAGGFAPGESRAQRYYLASEPPRTGPWLVLLVASAALEGAGLALGGHSSIVPTLSTTLDHLLDSHLERAILFLAWLWVGARPGISLWRHRLEDRA